VTQLAVCSGGDRLRRMNVHEAAMQQFPLRSPLFNWRESPVRCCTRIARASAFLSEWDASRTMARRRSISPTSSGMRRNSPSTGGRIGVRMRRQNTSGAAESEKVAPSGSSDVAALRACTPFRCPR